MQPDMLSPQPLVSQPIAGHCSIVCRIAPVDPVTAPIETAHNFRLAAAILQSYIATVSTIGERK